LLVLLSPAKRLDFDTPVTTDAFSTPAMLSESGKLMRTARNLSQKKLRELMDISPELAKLNADRYKQLTTELSPDNARQAVLTFNGQVYAGLDAGSLDQDGLDFAQTHLGILSGLYGYLRPLDLMQPYRLEMGTKLKTRRGGSLYDFWGDRIQAAVKEQLARLETDTIMNLASNEYFKAVRSKTLGARVIAPAFLETKDGKSRTLFVFAKLARGRMARYIIDNRITDPEALKAYDWDGYRFRPDLSEGDRWVYERPQPPPAR